MKAPRAPRREAREDPFLVLPDGTVALVRKAGKERSRLLAELQREAMSWCYALRNRGRWAGQKALSAQQMARAARLLEKLGVTPEDIGRLARAGIVQVVVPYAEEKIGWESRILPWEFVVSAATRALRAGAPLSVIRQLDTGRPPARLRPRAGRAVLYVESAPGVLAKHATFDSERELVRTGLSGFAWHELRNPTRELLAQEVKRLRPDVIHLAGFDTHQGLSIAAQEAARGARDGNSVQDGYVLATASGGLDPVGAEELARLLSTDGASPRLVGCNLWNSASRTAAMIVAYGASAALGIQDAIDDGPAEAFFGAFYRHFGTGEGDLSASFSAAWGALQRGRAALLGTGLVLWSEARLVGPGEREPVRAREAARRVIEPEAVSFLDAEKLVRVVVEPLDELNYSLLHNGRPLFKKLQVVHMGPERLAGLDLTVELCGGAGGFPFRKNFDIEELHTDLRRDVRVALTQDLLRQVRETVSTSLFVELSWGKHVLHRNTYPVRLLPADQWRDTDDDRLWLPSFVFPRDPAVQVLLERAQHYVRVLRDDPTAGFDGYQSIDDQLDDPTEDVDLQVQAIWSAVVHEWRLGYVNPPPTYSRDLDSQRLRTPTQILHDRSGTCIDLALLFAACLELCDVYPVIFLYADHAFPGYWRSPDAHEEFRQALGGLRGEDADEKTSLAAPEAGFAGTMAEGWILGKSSFDEIIRRVDAGDLVPLEAVALTEQSGFAAALEKGRENLRRRREFDSMIDVVTAREQRVTPLPIKDET